MQGYNILGLNIHDTLHSSNKLEQILRGASKNLDSFKEVEEAFKNFYTKEEVDLLLSGYSPEEGISLADYLKKKEAELLYQPKGNYLTAHLDLTNYALKSDIPTKLSLLLLDIKYLTEHQPLDEYAKKSDIPSLEGYLTEHQDLSNYAKKSDLIDIESLYQILNDRLSILENSEPSSSYKFKAYYAIVPGENPTEFKNNIANISNFTELTDQVSELNSGDSEGMLIVLYKNWIPKFNVFDAVLNKWQDLDTELKSVSNFTKTIEGESYFVWYNTGATIDKNKLFKIILQ